MVSRAERQPDHDEMLRFVADDLSARLWCGGPGIIESVNLAAMTCVVQPAIQATVRQQTGKYVLVTLPLLTDVPLLFPQGGGLALTFPVAAGDECFFHIADRCVSLWWKLGGIQAQERLRMHDLSDGFAFVGVNSQPNVFTVSPNSARIGKKDGTAFVEITQAGAVNISAPGGFNVTGKTALNGNVVTIGTLDNNSVNVGSTHEHTGVQTGTGTSGPPVNVP